ncbi:MAG: hypothetical protein QM489_05565, partial [Candidatus Izemoplasma sp.]
MIKKSRKVSDYKKLTMTLPTLRFVNPERVYIHLTNARCKTYDLHVKEGDQVLIGEVIGVRHGGFFEQPVHSTVSGTVEGFEKKFHRTGRKTDVVVIRNNHKEEFHSS